VSTTPLHSTRRIPALSSTIKSVMYSLYDRFRVPAPVMQCPNIKNLN
jgi:hypothetical protein